MVRSINYSYNPHDKPGSLFMEIPSHVVDYSANFVEGLSRRVRETMRHNATRLAVNERGDFALEILLGNIGRKGLDAKQASLKSIDKFMSLAVETDGYSNHSGKLRLRDYEIPYGVTSYGPFSINVIRPEVEIAETIELASLSMRAAAKSLRYMSNVERHKRERDRWVDKFVFAEVDYDTGRMILQTDPVSTAAMGAGVAGNEHEFMARSPLNTEQKLICLAGAIAIANADELLAAA